MKVFNVTGDFLDPAGAKTQTQDFTFNNAPILELKDVGTAAEIFAIRERNFDDKARLEREIKARPDAELQMAPAGLPNRHMASCTMYSQSAYRFGEHVCKYALFPTGELQRELASSREAEIGGDSAPEQHSQWLRGFFARHAGEYDFRVQLLASSVEEQSVEDASMEWDEEKYPFETVARITIPAGQDSFDAARRTFWEDRMKLNVWYGLEEHRPLGSVNRLRRAVYQTSVEERQKMNAVEVHAVSSVDQIP